MAYQAIPPANSGSCASDPWGDAAAAFVASKDPALVNVVFRNKCNAIFAAGLAAGGGSQDLERAAVSGTGANAAMDPTKNGGVIKFSTGTTGGSFRIVRNANGTAAAGLRADLVTSIRTSKWAMAGRVLVGTVGAGTDFEILRITDEATPNADVILRALGSTSTTNWALTVGAGATADTGVALPTLAFATIAVIGDGTNVQAWNVGTGAAIGASQAQSGAGNVVGHFVSLATDSGTTDRSYWLDDVIFITEPAT